MTAIEAYILARAYTRQAIEGAGALKGAPCQIQSIEAITGGNRITFAWETGEGETETDTLDVMDGADGDDGVGIASITYKETDAQGNNIYTVTLTSGSTYDITCPKGVQGETGATGATGNGIVSIAKTSTEGLVDTYTITYTNGSTSTFTVTNGATPTVDNEMSESSENPLQNKVITAWTSAATKSVTGNPITISDAAAVKAKALSVSIDPVQDLHGYDKPWVGGAYKNKAKPKNYSSDSYDGTTFNSPLEGAKVIDNVVLPAGTYVASIKMLSVPSTQRTLTFYKTGDVELAYFVNLNEKTVGQVYTTTFTLSEESTVYAKSWATGGGEWKMQMQLEAGDQATTFAPYTNICPISGHTEASVQRDGKNRLPLYTPNSVTSNGVTATLNADGSITFSGTATSNASFSIKNNGSLNDNAYASDTKVLDLDADSYYTISKYNDSGKLRILVLAAETPAQSVIVDFINENSASFKEHPSYKIIMRVNSGTTINETVKLQLEKGSKSTHYVPYADKTYTIALGDTIYGGTVDFDSGVMTVTHGYVDLGTITWYYSSGDKRFYAWLNSGKRTAPGNVANIICDRYRTVSWYDYVTLDGVCASAYLDAVYIGIRDLRYDNVSDFTTAMDGVQLVYELATPTTVQLTPQQIQLLKGTNTLTANGATISLTYQPDNLVGEIMEQVEPQIEDLQGQIDEIPILVDYSTTEQKTGQKWIDGRDIYQKSIKVLAADFVQDGNLYRIDYPLQSTDEVLNIVAIAHSASYGDVILGSKAYSDNTPTAYWEMVTYYNYLALTFSGGLTFAIVSPEYIDATYFYVKSTT